MIPTPQTRLEAAFTPFDTGRDALLALRDLFDGAMVTPSPHQTAAALSLVSERLTDAYEALYGKVPP